ncbi:phosphoserine phosphatase [Enterococcus sp. PF1-24]|uniref:haloacid dehalogenase-like hydrolase n=1 Tax=unclassified Enterococcus TaxID=2608891 RepID=UPI0024767C33|nr:MULTISPECIES: HAD family hydrolase [unclassified Enterococcus]MDH6365274.1 phosphoserine phosphatase [Enterococcus sp. PFB1-1]MDH6402396.1 phosphoserine phosphatase [Enterococcus sp. PF1-24]
MKKKTVYLSCTLALFLLGACTTKKEETTKTEESTTVTSSTATEEITILSKGNFYEPNYQALNQLILDNGDKSSDYDEKNKPYAVFDWDNTTIINDIGEAVFTYQIANLRFKMTPDELYNALKMNIPTDDFSEDWQNSAGESLNIDKMAEDIKASYTVIYDAYTEFAGEQSLEEVKKTEEYLDFAAKLRYLYEAIGDSFSSDISYPWVTYLFTGMTSEEVQSLSKEVIDQASTQELRKVTWKSSTSLETKAGQIEISFKEGIRLVPEMQDLYQKLQENGIEVYVCSASYIDVIIPFATDESYGYGVPEEHVYAMQLQKADNVIQSQLNEEFFQTQGEGKTQTIKKFIAPNHGDAGPILVAGDSNGDVAMLSDFPEMKVGLIFNRGKDGGIGELCQTAAKTEGTAEQRYYLQGRDENLGTLIPETETMLLGADELTVTEK